MYVLNSSRLCWTGGLEPKTNTTGAEESLSSEAAGRENTGCTQDYQESKVSLAPFP